eukprot:CAMPEP_0172806666 /NCGR_PEP_ID=MMETSP1075-20121228/6499_1 /TAXON_ID=2916 /ORGANISM="Ceratium fusus, Strain PA161109" /LENGTH=346 /DNA_ID=CAMNT_0013645493 /DNA_START=194 /DNA_END=1234 /DNA_ORIENTATION=-
MQFVGEDNIAAYAAVCFEQMLQREQQLEHEFCVFYHSFNGAALLYEVQAEIARCAFGLPDQFAPLPRIFASHFHGVHIDQLKSCADSASRRDHDPAFRALGLSTSVTLFAFGSEAPPLHCFRHGYGLFDLSFRGLLVQVLFDALDVRKERAEQLADALDAVGNRFGLCPGGYGSHSRDNTRPSRLGGQMLQMFVRRGEVDRLSYHSQPFGVPINTTQSVEHWLAGKSTEQIDGQARLLGDPRVFTDPARGQIFHYAGDWEFHGGSPSMEGSRAAFVLELRRVLAKGLWDQTRATIRARLGASHDFSTSGVAGGTSESVRHAAASDASTAKLSDPTRRRGKAGRRKR